MDKEKLDLLDQFTKEVLFWNEKINLVSRKDIDNLNIHHLLYSLSVAKVIRFREGAEILDVGSGGGFPGIPLAIYFDRVSFTLIDSQRKKTEVLNKIILKLGLKNIRVRWGRAEDLSEKYDFILGRAVTALPDFVDWTFKLINPESRHDKKNGILYLKGGDFLDEMKKVKGNISLFDLKCFFYEPFFETKKIVFIH
ncbi:MAG: 16S rRNA (guanine(527)-N(7))-methyltransferase RsmG [Bacteroidales bacterium]|nr:16S rRNA (guanine(527)-N(7))-methyltransferase RsmG [Bacteroidales bacterium]